GMPSVLVMLVWSAVVLSSSTVVASSSDEVALVAGAFEVDEASAESPLVSEVAVLSDVGLVPTVVVLVSGPLALSPASSTASGLKQPVSASQARPYEQRGVI